MTIEPTNIEQIGLAVFMGLAGLCVGSFLGTCCFRLVPSRTSVEADGVFGLLFGRSVCRSCGRRLDARDLVPVVSWVVRRGRCRCGSAISRVYPLVEIGSAAAFIMAMTAVDGAIHIIAVGLLGAVLLALSVIDVRHLVLPDPLVVTVAALGLASAVVEPAAMGLGDAAAGAALAGGLLWLLREGFRRLRGVVGLGLGDVKLAAAGGLWVGWQGIGEALLLASCLTLLVLGLRAVLGQPIGRLTRIPFGPGLAAGVFLTVLEPWSRLESLAAGAF
ncbi:MAG: prepilin peptidase [Proteobacteria bacterium]|nr:prepilin peptidase [Pseudomonadota bacterium]